MNNRCPRCGSQALALQYDGDMNRVYKCLLCGHEPAAILGACEHCGGNVLNMGDGIRCLQCSRAPKLADASSDGRTGGKHLGKRKKRRE